MTNINEPTFDEPREHPGFRCLRARLSRQAGSERLGLSLWELPSGEAAYPYHYHLAEEELVLVLDGQPSLRTPDGWQELQEGEVVPFLRGEPRSFCLSVSTCPASSSCSLATNGAMPMTSSGGGRRSRHRPRRLIGIQSRNES